MAVSRPFSPGSLESGNCWPSSLLPGYQPAGLPLWLPCFFYKAQTTEDISPVLRELAQVTTAPDNLYWPWRAVTLAKQATHLQITLQIFLLKMEGRISPPNSPRNQWLVELEAMLWSRQIRCLFAYHTHAITPLPGYITRLLPQFLSLQGGREHPLMLSPGVATLGP
jgi:hypothetical protein